jgi:hypothetical protein
MVGARTAAVSDEERAIITRSEVDILNNLACASCRVHCHPCCSCTVFPLASVPPKVAKLAQNGRFRRQGGAFIARPLKCVLIIYAQVLALDAANGKATYRAAVAQLELGNLDACAALLGKLGALQSPGETAGRVLACARAAAHHTALEDAATKALRARYEQLESAREAKVVGAIRCCSARRRSTHLLPERRKPNCADSSRGREQESWHSLFLHRRPPLMALFLQTRTMPPRWSVLMSAWLNPYSRISCPPCVREHANFPWKTPVSP